MCYSLIRMIMANWIGGLKMNYTIERQDGWFWCRWWFNNRWCGTLIYRTEREAENAAFEKMNVQGV